MQVEAATRTRLRFGGGGREAGGQPGRQAAIEDPDALVAEIVEHPPQPGGDPAADVVIDHDVVRVADPDGLEAFGQVRRLGQRMPARPGRRREVGVEVEEDRARDVPDLVAEPARAGRAHHPADVDDPEVRRVEPRVERFGRDDR